MNTGKVIDEINRFMWGLDDEDMIYNPVVAHSVCTLDEWAQYQMDKFQDTLVWDENYGGEVPTHMMRVVTSITSEDGLFYYGQDIPLVSEDGELRFLGHHDPDIIYGGGPDFNGGTKEEVEAWLASIGTPVVWII